MQHAADREQYHQELRREDRREASKQEDPACSSHRLQQPVHTGLALLPKTFAPSRGWRMPYHAYVFEFTYLLDTVGTRTHTIPVEQWPRAFSDLPAGTFPGPQ